MVGQACLCLMAALAFPLGLKAATPWNKRSLAVSWERADESGRKLAEDTTIDRIG